MATPVVSPVRGCGPDSGERGPSAGKLMSLSHSLAADVLSRTSSNMLNNATESSRACGRVGGDWLDKARYRYVWSAAGLQAKTSDGGLVCANVFGLQRDAFPGLDGFRPLSSLLGCWPWGAASDIRFRKRRFDRCAIFESASRPGEHRYSVRCCC